MLVSTESVVRVSTERIRQGEFLTTINLTIEGKHIKTYKETYVRCTIPYALHKALYSALAEMKNTHIVVESDDYLFLRELVLRDQIERSLTNYLKKHLESNKITLSARLLNSDGRGESSSEF